ncbi:MAG: hypothetical protein WC061_10995, partial [Melioribacteraceae bacterium]
RNEIVTRINIPIPGKNLSGEFYKLGRRRAVAISRITLALLIDLKNNLFNEIRIASGAVTPTGVRFYDLENFAQGKKADENFIKELSGKLGEKVIEAAGLRWSSEYKLPVIQQVFYQLLMGMERRS